MTLKAGASPKPQKPELEKPALVGQKKKIKNKETDMNIKQRREQLDFANQRREQLDFANELFNELYNQLGALKDEREEERVMRMEAESQLEECKNEMQILLEKTELFHMALSIQFCYSTLTLLVVMIAIIFKG